MSWLPESLTVLGEQWSGILRLLAAFGMGTLLTFGLLRRMLWQHLDTADTFLLSLAGWPLWWAISAFLGFFMARWLELGPGWTAFLLSVFGLALLPGWKQLPAPFGRLSPLLAVLALAFLLSLLTRLAFLSDVLVPSYFDGAFHYQISQRLLTDFGRWPWEASPPLTSGYYHTGFHLLAASVAFAANLELPQVLLLLGQFTLAALPFPVFLAVKRETGSTLAAFFALLLAGWGWNMPAHALNWGKYPALMGLSLLQFALAVAFITPRPASRRLNLSLLVLFSVAAILATLMHTRALVVIFIVIGCSLAAAFWERLLPRLRWAILAVLLAGLGGLVLYIESRGILNLVFDPYLRAGQWITLLAAALSPFAFRRFARFSITSLLTLFLLLACLLIPMPGESFQTLLDRPFVQMTLYLPLALLGGLGLAGLRAESFRGWQSAWTTAAIFSALLVAIGRDYPFAASRCCILLQADDAVAFDWMDVNLPEDAHILIAGNTLNVFDIENPAELRAGDGGAWIAPLTGRRVSMEHIGLDFSAAQTLDRLCARGITHIYVGSGPERFDQTGLLTRPEWYARQLTLPGANIFQVTGCP